VTEHPESTGPESTESYLSIDLNCPWCLAATVEALEADPRVRALRVHSARGCLEITHTGPVEAVVGIVTSIGHTIEVASNGEAVMAPATAQVTRACTRHGTPRLDGLRTGSPP
jgi:hypothetical protein